MSSPLLLHDSPEPFRATEVEADVLLLIDAVCGRLPLEIGLKILLAERDVATNAAGQYLIRPEFKSQLNRRLSTGLMVRLTELGGWREECFLVERQPVTGRFWQRTALENVHVTFSGHFLQTLLSLISASITKVPLSLTTPPRCFGDTWFYTEFYARFRGVHSIMNFFDTSLFSHNPYLRYLYPDDFNEHILGQNAQAKSERVPPLCFNQQPDAIFWEILQRQFVHRWTQVEREKRVCDSAQLTRISLTQEHLLNHWLQETEKAERRDLCRWILQTIKQLSAFTNGSEPPTATEWFQNASPTNDASNREFSFPPTALCLFKAVEQCAEWARWARSLRFYDEDYPLGQQWLLDWEQLDGARWLLWSQQFQHNCIELFRVD